MSPQSHTTSLRALARRDGTLAVALGVLVGVASLLAGLSWPEAGIGAALCTPLAWRTRRPWVVLALVTCGSIAYLALVDSIPGFGPPTLVALYTVASHGTRRQTVALAGGSLLLAVVIAMLFDTGDEGIFARFFQEFSLFATALAIGDAVRSRREAIGAMRERAERAEREQDLEARRRVDEERVRIARDVHDVVAHSMATISTQASVGLHIGREDPERALNTLESIKQVSTRALHDLRSALGVLREEPGEGPTAPAPSIEVVPELIRQVRSTGLPIDLRMEGSPGELASALQIGIYRIVQEGLTNVMRHADGAEATVRIAVGEESVEVEVIDDGNGSPTSASRSGAQSGLVGMRERATALGGAFEAGHREGGGFRGARGDPGGPRSAMTICVLLADDQALLRAACRS